MSRELSRQFESAVVVERRQSVAPDGGGGRNLGRRVVPGSTPVDRRRAQVLAAAVQRKPVLQGGR